jgi:fibronectin type 3 domain-containing protein
MTRGMIRKPVLTFRITLIVIALELLAGCGGGIRLGSTTSHSVDLSWTASTSTDVIGYNVYRSASPSGPFERLNSALVSGTTYTDYTVTSGATYYYAVTAVDSSGGESGYSNVAEATVP